MTKVLGSLWLLQGLAAAIVVMNPRWREGLLVRLGLVFFGLGSVPVAIELLAGEQPTARAVMHAAAAQAFGLQLVLLGWCWRSWRRGAPQRRTTDWGGLDSPRSSGDRKADAA